MKVIASHLTPALPGTALNWIDGEWVDANKTTDSFDPATGERIGPSQFSRETGMVVGANSATAQCGEWKEDEWQELLARLSTDCKV
jgi:acyl-CoA reductase-like NAD-dependent aldehyde dehydrogenase